jgi:hypothetical protein
VQTDHLGSAGNVLDRAEVAERLNMHSISSGRRRRRKQRRDAQGDLVPGLLPVESRRSDP